MIISSPFVCQTWSQHGSNYSLHTPDDALYVYECVELELGLLFTDDDKKYNCPIHLHCDKGNKSRYYQFEKSVHMGCQKYRNFFRRKSAVIDQSSIDL